jgi:hypothetical protein
MKWKVVTVTRDQMESSLNSYQQQGWEIFAVVPTLKFENTKVVMATVSLPKAIEYDLIMRRENV